jgi:hypothetical protein
MIWNWHRAKPTEYKTKGSRQESENKDEPLPALGVFEFANL